jgi:NADH-ubiquinone oxidoreductase chain 6
MTNLIMLNETFTNGFSYNFLNIISLASVICGLLVITSKNPIVSVLFLIGLFFNIAGYLMMLGINFIGLSYLLVYVGAVSILFLFILMLINVRISELVTDNNNGVPLAIMIGIIFNLMLHKLLPSNSSANEYNFVINNMDANNVNAHTLITNDSNNISYALNNIFTLNNNDLLFVSSQI